MRRAFRQSGIGLAIVSMLLLVLWSSAGCGPKVGVTKEMVIDEGLTGAAVTQVRLLMGEGKLAVSPGAEGLVSGTISYNVEAWKPVISRTDERVVIRQGSTKGLSGGGQAVNQWALQLGRAPMRLEVEAGVYEGVLSLGGLSLQGLDVQDGAAHSQVIFGEVNVSQMERLRYHTGASEVTMAGLANANFKQMEFSGAAGTYSLDFSGELRSDGTAEITVAAGTLTIRVPSTTRVQLTIKNTLADVSSQGSWTIDGTTYRTPALVDDDAGKTLVIELEMTAGSAVLVCQ